MADGKNYLDVSIEYLKTQPPIPLRVFFSEVARGFRTKTTQLIEKLHGLVMVFLRDKYMKEKVFDWFGKVCDTNKARTRSGQQMGFETSPVSSDGFLNITTMVMLRLCDPFTELTERKAIVSVYCLNCILLSIIK